jgi:hypothetical protein
MKKEIMVLIIIISCIMLSGCNEEPTASDRDNDGVPDHKDAFPDDPAVSIDSDGDGYPDKFNEGYTQNDTDKELDMFPDDKDKHRDSDLDGYADSEDDFIFDPELHKSTHIKTDYIQLKEDEEELISFNVAEGTKYVSVYWEIEPYNTDAGQTISFRFKKYDSWDYQKYHGRSNQAKIEVDEAEIGGWKLRITHDEYRTGYKEDIAVDYRIHLLE